MKRQLFVLNPDGTVREASNRQEFLSFMDEDSKKILIKDSVYKICEVVTSFLGKESFTTSKTRNSPQLFETLVSGGVIDGSVRTYSSYDAALAGHKSIVRLVHNNIH